MSVRPNRETSFQSAIVDGWSPFSGKWLHSLDNENLCQVRCQCVEERGSLMRNKAIRVEESEMECKRVGEKRVDRGKKER